MFWNHKELAIFWKARNFFQELDSFDNYVAGSLHQIANFHSNIKHSNLSTKLF